MGQKIIFKVSTLLLLLTIVCQSVYLAKTIKPHEHSYSHRSESSITNINGDVKIAKKEEVSRNGKSAQYSTFIHKKGGKIKEERTEGDRKKVQQLKKGSIHTNRIGNHKSSQSKFARRHFDHFDKLERLHMKEFARFDRHMAQMERRMFKLHGGFKHLMGFRHHNKHLLDRKWDNHLDSFWKDPQPIRQKKASKSRFYSQSYAESYKNDNGKVEQIIQKKENDNGKKKDIKKTFRTDKDGKVLQNETIKNGMHLEDANAAPNSGESAAAEKSPYLDAAFEAKEQHADHKEKPQTSEASK